MTTADEHYWRYRDRHVDGSVEPCPVVKQVEPHGVEGFGRSGEYAVAPPVTTVR